MAPKRDAHGNPVGSCELERLAVGCCLTIVRTKINNLETVYTLSGPDADGKFSINGLPEYIRLNNRYVPVGHMMKEVLIEGFYLPTYENNSPVSPNLLVTEYALGGGKIKKSLNPLFKSRERNTARRLAKL